MPAPYSYRPLIHDRNMRVLKLEGSDNPDAVPEFKLIEASLDCPPKYYAVSYCWGQQPATVSVLCDGKELLVTPNCEAALRRFRKSANQTVILWIDAICINQRSSDNAERNHQVSHMGEIYECANQVWIWLGSEKLLPLSTRDIRVLEWFRDLDVAAANPVSKQARKEIVKLSENIHFIDVEMIATQIPWFRRLWVVQEVALSNSAVLFWDKIEINFNSLCRASEFLWNSKTRILTGDALRVSLDFFYQASRYKKPEAREGISIPRFMFWARNFGTTNPKDKVFAIHSLLRIFDVDLPPPDYSKSTAQIYREATQAIMSYSNSLALLTQVNGINVVPDLASWVPDWSSVHSQTPFVGDRDDPLLATRDSSPYYSFVNDNLHLRVRGKIVDTVDACADLSFVSSLSDRGAPEEYLKWCDEIRLKDLTLPKPPTAAQYRYVLPHLWNLKVLQNFVMFAAATSSNAEAYEERIVFYSCLCSSRQYSFSDVTKDLDIWDAWRALLMQYEPSWKDYRGARWDLQNLRKYITRGKNQSTFSTAGGDFWKSVANSRRTTLERSCVAETIECKTFEAISEDLLNSNILSMIMNNYYFQRLFRTGSGTLGVAPRPFQVGDKIALISGLNLPVIIRPCGENYRLVAYAYVYGIMHGEAWSFLNGMGKGLQDITFV